MAKETMRPLSLKTAVVLGISFGILVPALIVGIFLAQERYQRGMEVQVTSLLHQYGDMLQQTLPAPVWQLDTRVGQSIVDAVMTNPNVVKISVDDPSLGQILVAENPPLAGGEIVTDTRQITWEGRIIGRVSIEMSTARVEQELFENMLKVGLALLLQLTISIVLLVLLGETRLMRPLKRLQQNVDQLFSGELSQAVVALRQDEIGELAQGVDRMRQRLAHHIEEIRELNHTLEKRVIQRTQDLKTVNQDLVSAMTTLKSAQAEIQRTERLAALGALVAGVAHELNTPIGTSITVASTLRDMSLQLNQALETGLTRSGLATFVHNTHEASDMLMRNLETAAHLIGSFKQVAVDRTSAQRRRFSLNHLVATTLETMGTKRGNSRLDVSVDVPKDIEMDSYPGPLGQVLGNLVQNATIHAFEPAASGNIQISARLPTPDTLEITCSDNGKGIDPENLGRIFDPFFTTRLGLGGSGLGLSIVYNLVRDVLGGRITAENQTGGGARFIVRIPLIAPDAPAASQ
jgi:two-component system NtrC family sensor kinase